MLNCENWRENRIIFLPKAAKATGAIRSTNAVVHSQEWIGVTMQTTDIERGAFCNQLASLIVVSHSVRSTDGMEQLSGRDTFYPRFDCEAVVAQANRPRSIYLAQTVKNKRVVDGGAKIRKASVGYRRQGWKGQRDRIVADAASVAYLIHHEKPWLHWRQCLRTAFSRGYLRLEYGSRRIALSLSEQLKADFAAEDTSRVNEMLSTVDTMISRLPESYQQTAELIKGGMTQTEIAAALGVSQPMIAKRVRRMREALENIVNE